MEINIPDPDIIKNQKPDPDTLESRKESDKEYDYYYEEVRHLRLHNNLLVQYDESLLSDRLAREKYGHRTFCGVLIYMVFVLLVVCLNGNIIFGKWNIFVNDNVLIALVGSTSINVIGLLAIVLRSTFSNDRHKILDGKRKIAKRNIIDSKLTNEKTSNSTSSS